MSKTVPLFFFSLLKSLVILAEIKNILDERGMLKMPADRYQRKMLKLQRPADKRRQRTSALHVER